MVKEKEIATDFLALFINEWDKITQYFEGKEEYVESMEYINKWLIREAVPFVLELKIEIEQKEYTKEEIERLKKYLIKYKQFFEYIGKEQDEKYRNERVFKALEQVPSEVKDLMERRRV